MLDLSRRSRAGVRSHPADPDDKSAGQIVPGRSVTGRRTHTQYVSRLMRMDPKVICRADGQRGAWSRLADDVPRGEGARPDSVCSRLDSLMVQLEPAAERHPKMTYPGRAARRSSRLCRRCGRNGDYLSQFARPAYLRLQEVNRQKTVSGVGGARVEDAAGGDQGLLRPFTLRNRWAN